MGAVRLPVLSRRHFGRLRPGEPSLQGNQPNTEVFLNVLLTTAFAIFVRAERKRIGFGGAILLGALFTIASFYKQIVILQAAFLSVAYLLSVDRPARRSAFAEIGIVAAIGATGWSLLYGYFSLQKRGNAFVEAVFTYNRWYSAHPERSLIDLWLWPGLPCDALAVALPMVALALIGLVIGLRICPRHGWLLLLAFGIATYVTVQLPGWFFPHYYQLWFPPLVIGAGWGGRIVKASITAALCVVVLCAGRTLLCRAGDDGNTLLPVSGQILVGGKIRRNIFGRQKG